MTVHDLDCQTIAQRDGGYSFSKLIAAEIHLLYWSKLNRARDRKSGRVCSGREREQEGTSAPMSALRRGV